ncbi:winged helix-turn-helix domain-containing protein [Dietzia sp. NPDC055877]
MPRTSAQTLRLWLLDALLELGGSGTKREVLDEIERQYGHLVTDGDRQMLTSRNEIKWENSVAWERSKLVDERLLAPDSPKNWWSLTGAGVVAAERSLQTRGRKANTVALPEPETAPPAEATDRPQAGQSINEFKPKNSGEYRVAVKATEQVKSRHHEKLISDYGAWLVTGQFRPVTNCHPIDFMVKGGAQPALGEAKILYKGNATNAVREASAQLLMYRHFLYPNEKCELLALFSEDVGRAYVNFLTSLNIHSVWWDGISWTGSKRAYELGLAKKVIDSD